MRSRRKNVIARIKKVVMLMNPERNDIEEIIDLAMQDTVPCAAISQQFGISPDEIVSIMRKHLTESSYRRWKQRRQLSAFRKHSTLKPKKHRVHATNR